MLDASKAGSRQKFWQGRVWFDTLRSEGAVDLAPIDLTQQFPDAVLRAKDPDLYVLNEWGIGFMDKEIAIDIVYLFPAAGLAVAEK